MTDTLPGSGACPKSREAGAPLGLVGLPISTCSFIGARHSMSRYPGARAAGPAKSRAGIRVDKAMDMDDEIAHLRTIDGSLGFGSPGGISRRVVRKHADDVEFGKVFE